MARNFPSTVAHSVGATCSEVDRLSQKFDQPANRAVSLCPQATTQHRSQDKEDAPLFRPGHLELAHEAEEHREALQDWWYNLN